MATKRKLQPHYNPSPEQPKRLSLGKGSSAKYHQHGQDLARKGKFHEAIEVFSEGLLQEDATGDNRMNLLDSRSTIYCQVSMYETALKDARLMIGIDKLSERGYLRAGRTLILDKAPQKALDVYEIALKRLPSPQRGAVEKIYGKLKATLSARLRDPVTYLNHDCLFTIFKDIPFRQIVTMTCVSKTWRAYLMSEPTLWYNMSFKAKRYPTYVPGSQLALMSAGSQPLVSRESFKAYIQTSQKRVRVLQIHDVANSLDALQQLPTCQLLEHLDLDIPVLNYEVSNLLRAQNTLKTLILGGNIIMDRANLIKLAALPLLERLEAHCFAIVPNMNALFIPKLPNLKALVLKMTCFPGAPPYQHLWVSDDSDLFIPHSHRAPKLEELRIATRRGNDGANYRTSASMTHICHPNLKTLEIRDLFVRAKWTLSEKIENLRFVNCNASDAEEWRPDSELVFPNLKSLEFINLDWDEIGNKLYYLLAHNKGTLETFRVEGCDRFDLTDVAYIVSQSEALRNLKVLSLHGVRLRTCHDDAILHFLRGMTELQELHVPETAVTGKLIKNIVQSTESLPRIKILNVKNCADVSSEAVKFGRLNGMKIITK